MDYRQQDDNGCVFEMSIRSETINRWCVTHQCWFDLTADSFAPNPEHVRLVELDAVIGCIRPEAEGVMYKLWAQAMREHDHDPDDPGCTLDHGRDEEVQARYRDLLIERGILR